MASVDFEKLGSEPRDVIIKTLIDESQKILATKPQNRCCKYLAPYLTEAGGALTDEEVKSFYRCVRTGVENPDSDLGCYAMKPGDYETFHPFFNKVIRDYHDDPSGVKKHTTDWDISDIGNKGVLDLQKLGLSEELSMRVRVGRNLKSFNLPGAMDQAERIKFEKTLLKAFDVMIKDPAYGGTVYSLTPDFGAGEKNPNLITKEHYKQLVDDHIIFKEMDDDPYLKSAGISSDWPYGRGCWQSADKQRIIWFGEEDQLRIMCMKKGFKLNEVFDKLKELLDKIESVDGIDFARCDSHSYGYVTSCPTNLGTGMRASVHIKVPQLTSDGSDTKAKAVCKPLGLSVRGVGGEFTPIGKDGTIDISPKARLFIREKDIIAKLYQGIAELLELERGA